MSDRCQETVRAGSADCKNRARFVVRRANVFGDLRVCGTHVRFWRDRTRYVIEEIKPEERK